MAISCKNQTETIDKVSTSEPTEEVHVLGNYVSESYSQRSEGYDWVGVTIDEAQNDQIAISIRSRADKKKPTCTFDAKAVKVDDHLYESQINGKLLESR